MIRRVVELQDRSSVFCARHGSVAEGQAFNSAGRAARNVMHVYAAMRLTLSAPVTSSALPPPDGRMEDSVACSQLQVRSKDGSSQRWGAEQRPVQIGCSECCAVEAPAHPSKDAQGLCVWCEARHT